MSPIVLTASDLALASGLVLSSALLSLLLSLGIHRTLLIAAARMVVQLLLVGVVLLFVFRQSSPWLTILVLAVMMAAASYEVGSRQHDRLRPFWHYGIGSSATITATLIVSMLGLLTALRPHPWFDARTAIPLTGLILGNVMNAASLSLNSLLTSVRRERASIEARLMLGATGAAALASTVRQAVRTALIPTMNSMAAAGIITMPGIMTGQLLAGMNPLAAAKYQILLMFMIVSGNVLGAVGTAYLAAWHLTDDRGRLRLDRLQPR